MTIWALDCSTKLLTFASALHERFWPCHSLSRRVFMI